MQQKPIIKIMIGIFLVAVVFAVTQIQSHLSDEPSRSAKPETQVQNAEIPEKTELEAAESQEEQTEEKPVGEELRNTVSNILDNAFGFFAKNDLDIVAIGDSLTQGVGDETNNGGYVGILENTLNEEEQHVTIENYGKRGNRTDQLLERMKETEIAASLEQADVILITIGANDIMKVVKNNIANLKYEPFEEEQKAYEDRLDEILGTMVENNPDADIYLIGFYNPFESYFENVDALTQILHNWNDSSRTVAADYEEVKYIPVDDLFGPEEYEYFAEDNFHPNKSGYRLIAERVFEHIRPSIEQTEENENDDETEQDTE